MKTLPRKLLALAFSLAVLTGFAARDNAAVISNGLRFEYVKIKIGVSVEKVTLPDGSPIDRRKVVIPDMIDGLPVTELRGFNKSPISEVIIPDTVTYLGLGNFGKCPYLERVVVGSGVKKIDSQCFFDCPRLKAVEFAPGSCLTTISASAFRKCTSLAEIALPASLTTISSEAFKECSALKTVTLPDSLEYIGSSAFMGCTSLKAIKLPASLTTLNNFAFAESGLVSLELPESVTVVDSGVCNKCPRLTAVKLGSNVTQIRRNAFSNCPLLRTINIPPTVDRIDSAAFGGSTPFKVQPR